MACQYLFYRKEPKQFYVFNKKINGRVPEEGNIFGAHRKTWDNLNADNELNSLTFFR